MASDLPKLHSVAPQQQYQRSNKDIEIRKTIINPNILNDIFVGTPNKSDIAESQRFFNHAKVKLEWTLADYDEIPDVKYNLLKSQISSTQAALSTKRTFGIKPELLKTLPEVLLMGRTNAGKSTLLNSILGARKNEPLAYVSSKAGFTKTMNSFRISNQLRLIDSPGYGKGGVESQGEMVLAYLNNRRRLKRVLLLVSSSDGFADEDLQLVRYLHERGIPVDIVFTKVDELLKKFLRKELFKSANVESIKGANQRIVEHYFRLVDESGLEDLTAAPRFMFNNSQTNIFLSELMGIKTIRCNLLRSCDCDLG
ncbi:hypothetical protein KGF57_002224 [Candida theae]|uniref:EngB-type G domain-containing protein n=1 Tax=Candida theae TaxID=1198502 RepID=A0AAD5BFX2_9ASCO|nr:uncharacterized protein KGF57_002224 [Candida theae]KAI5958790.1 hypothetical protein KGF57_002224 [Candida theae]